MLNITDIRIRTLNKNEKLLGVATITIDDCFAIHDIKIVAGAKGTFISFPSKKQNNSFVDIAHPINSETRDELQKKILEAFEEAKKAQPAEDTATA